MRPKYIVNQDFRGNATVLDTMTNTIKASFTTVELFGRTPETCRELAESRAAELNGADMAMWFAESIVRHIEQIGSDDYYPGNLMEDLNAILAYHIGQLRGTVREPLDQARLYYQASWINQP